MIIMDESGHVKYTKKWMDLRNKYERVNFVPHTNKEDQCKEIIRKISGHANSTLDFELEINRFN